MLQPGPDAFQAIWDRYPKRDKKVASRDALRWALQNHNADGALLEKIHAALTWQIEVHSEWRYWVTLDKWLLAQRWEDDPPLRGTPAQRAADVKHEAAKQQALQYWQQKQRPA